MSNEIKTNSFPPTFASKHWSFKELGEVCGTTDNEIILGRLNQMGRCLIPEPIESNGQLGDALQSMLEIKPKDTLERMLAMQMIACHHGSMESFRRSMIEGRSEEARIEDLKIAQKLTAAYAKLLDCLDRHRGAGQQTVSVNNVNVSAGGQAMVGNLNPPNSQTALAARHEVSPPKLVHSIDQDLYSLGLSDCPPNRFSRS